ncbi:MAG: hypothetical protein JO072_02535 [Parafilimonas sp.]|nr:hypothetical protein [Parafilimonas sp.]
MAPKKFRINVPRKIVRIALRTILIIAGLYLLLLVGLSLYISSSQDRLISFLKSKLKETILGELKVDNANITVWQSFPKLGITLKNVTISDSVYHRPFLQAKEITAKAGFLNLIGNKLTISSVKVQDAVIHTFTDAKGYSNIYVLKPQNKQKRKSKKPVVFNNLVLKNVIAISEDAIKNKRFQVNIANADIDMNLSGPKYSIKMNEDVLIRGLGFYLPKGYWLENQRVQARWKLEYDTSGNILSFNDTKVKIQGQPFTIKGQFFLNGPAHFHIDASTKQIDYAAAMAILKPTTSEKIKKINLTEPLDAAIVLDGPMAYRTIPLVKVNFATQGNAINTPVMNFTNCNFTGNFINQVNPDSPRTDDNSRVTINAFTSNWGDINLKAKNIAVTNLLKPNIQFEFFSECTLPQLDDQLASSRFRFITGNAKLYLLYNGPLTADASMLDQLNAKIQIENGKIVYVPRSLTFSECNGAIAITGNSLLMKDFQCNLNTNHFTVNITGENLNRISSKEPGKATINCNVYSPALNLADLKTLFAKKSQESFKRKAKGLGNTANAIDNAVEDGNLYVNLKAQQLSLHNFQASNVVANAIFTDNDWEIKKASLQHADGSFNLTAKVHQVNDELHQMSAQMNLQHINVKKLFYGFDNFGQTTITSANLKGIMDSKANITAAMNDAGKLISNTINGSLVFSLKNASLSNVKSLQNLQTFILKNRDLNNVEFAELKDTFDIQNGDIYIRRMPIQSSALTMYIEGTYSFGDRTDISIQVPLSTLTKKPENYKQIDSSKTEKPGPSIYLRAKEKNGQVKIGLDVFRKLHDKRYEKSPKDST